MHAISLSSDHVTQAREANRDYFLQPLDPIATSAHELHAPLPRSPWPGSRCQAATPPERPRPLPRLSMRSPASPADMTPRRSRE